MLGGEIGLWMGSSALNPMPATQVKEAVAEIEELGYAALWFGETAGREAFTNASMLLCATSRLVVATGIANIFMRDAWATNAAAMTLAGAYQERTVTLLPADASAGEGPGALGRRWEGAKRASSYTGTMGR